MQIAAAKMFDLGNYTIDTGMYMPAPNAEVSGPNQSLAWNWDTGPLANVKGGLHGHTMIIILTSPAGVDIGYIDLFTKRSLIFPSNWTIDQREDLVSGQILVGFVADRDGVAPKDLAGWKAFTNNLSTVFVAKPYRGWISTVPNNPTMKVYVGTIDTYNTLLVVSTEGDEMFSLLLQGLRAIPKEQAQSARLEAIKKFAES